MVPERAAVARVRNRIVELAQIFQHGLLKLVVVVRHLLSSTGHVGWGWAIDFVDYDHLRVKMQRAGDLAGELVALSTRDLP